MKSIFNKIRCFHLISLLAITLGITGAHSAVLADNQLSEKEAQEGWELLFNGNDMSKWRNFKKEDINPAWQIVDGAMVLTKKGGGDLISKKEYEDFEMQLEWKISKAGNSGIFVLADEKGEYIYSHAPEVQILDNALHPDNKKDSRLAGSLYDMVASPASSHKNAGAWNHVRIKLQEGHLAVWQNDVPVISLVIGSTTWNTLVNGSKFATWEGFGKAKKGHVGLQDHDDEVAFKNIKIKEL